MNIIAADVGGTKTRLIYADVDDQGRVLYESCYVSGDFDGFGALLKTFIDDSGLTSSQPESLILALPGLVSESSARLTNLPWVIEKQALKDTFGFRNVSFMNDFQASALGTGQLQEKDQIVLNAGISKVADLNDNATRVAVGAGTGLGVAWAQGDEGVMHAYDTEGGHVDFAPVDDTQIRLLQFLRERHGHVSYERILSGGGLVSLYEFCAGERGDELKSGEITAKWVNDQSLDNAAADEAMRLFVQIYGSYIGNIAMLFKPSGGIFITGGIAAKMVQRMQSEEFIHAYLNKGRMHNLVEQITVYLVTDERIGVLGAMSEAAKTQRVKR